MSLYQHRTACWLLRTGVAVPVALGGALAVSGFLAALPGQGMLSERQIKDRPSSGCPWSHLFTLSNLCHAIALSFPHIFLSFFLVLFYLTLSQEMYLIAPISDAQN